MNGTLTSSDVVLDRVGSYGHTDAFSVVHEQKRLPAPRPKGSKP